MKTTEGLQRGNFIEFSEDNSIFEIVEIDENGLAVKNAKEETWIEIESFEGVRLTIEILLKSNFTYISTDRLPESEGYWFNGFHIEAIGDMLMERRYGIHLKYVHQLQNFYFAVASKKLKIIF